MYKRQVDKIPQTSRALLDAAATDLSELCQKIDQTGETTEEDRKTLLDYAVKFVQKSES